MSLRILATGTLYRDPERRTAKTGRPFWTATVKTKDGDATQWVKVCVFSETASAELMRLKDGDACSVQGRFEVATYERDGKTEIRLTCIADAVLALRAPPKQRKPKAAPAASPTLPLEHRAPDRGFKSRCGAAVDGLDNSVPF